MLLSKLAIGWSWGDEISRWPIPAGCKSPHNINANTAGYGDIVFALITPPKLPLYSLHLSFMSYHVVLVTRLTSGFCRQYYLLFIFVSSCLTRAGFAQKKVTKESIVVLFKLRLKPRSPSRPCWFRLSQTKGIVIPNFIVRFELNMVSLERLHSKVSLGYNFYPAKTARYL